MCVQLQLRNKHKLYLTTSYLYLACSWVNNPKRTGVVICSRQKKRKSVWPQISQASLLISVFITICTIMAHFVCTQAWWVWWTRPQDAGWVTDWAVFLQSHTCTSACVVVQAAQKSKNLLSALYITCKHTLWPCNDTQYNYSFKSAGKVCVGGGILLATEMIHQDISIPAGQWQAEGAELAFTVRESCTSAMLHMERDNPASKLLHLPLHYFRRLTDGKIGLWYNYFLVLWVGLQTSLLLETQ